MTPRSDKINAREIVIIAMMSAILLAAQVVFAFLPNIELVSLLILIYTRVFKYKTLFIIYIFALLEGVVYGFTTWWFTYLYVWTILFIVVTLFTKLFKSDNVLIWSVISAVFGLLFGALCSITYLFIGGPAYAFSYWLNGIPFDIVHCIGNFFVCIVLVIPLYKLIDKLYNRR